MAICLQAIPPFVTTVPDHAVLGRTVEPDVSTVLAPASQCHLMIPTWLSAFRSLSRGNTRRPVSPSAWLNRKKKNQSVSGTPWRQEAPATNVIGYTPAARMQSNRSHAPARQKSLFHQSASLNRKSTDTAWMMMPAKAKI